MSLKLIFKAQVVQYSLWDPWGLFFIHLTHESGISNYKGINLGWMNLGGISFLLVFSIKMDDDIQSVFFHTAKEWNFITLQHEIQGMFLVCLQGMNFQQRMDEFWGVFLVCLQSINFQQRMDEFWGMFLSVCRVWISNKGWMNFKLCF